METTTEYIQVRSQNGCGVISLSAEHSLRVSVPEELNEYGYGVEAVKTAGERLVVFPLAECLTEAQAKNAVTHIADLLLSLRNVKTVISMADPETYEEMG